MEISVQMPRMKNIIKSWLLIVPKDKLLDRFRGQGSRKQLAEALLSYSLVANDQKLAAKMAAKMEVRNCKLGTVLTHQNAIDHDLFLIIDGEFAVIVNGRRVATRGHGQHVGEMALTDPVAKRSATVTALTDAVVGRISERHFSALAEKYPILWRRIAQELANRLRQRNLLVTDRRPDPVLFIGSSREALPIASTIHNALKRKLDVTLWSKSVFRASEVSIESLEKQIPEIDFAALVLSPDDRVISRRRGSDAPRDNVIFELGLFMGGLGRHRTFLVKPRGIDLKLPTDLLGVTSIDYTDGPPRTLRSRIAPVRAELQKLIMTTGTR